MKEDFSAFKKRIQSFQFTILLFMILAMLIGGSVFGLGVKARPILRITKPELFHHVEWILDLMIGTGIAQLGTAGLNCFATCWKLMWPLYLAIGLTALTVCLEVGSIGTSLQLLHTAEHLANEEIVHAWYWVECQETGSCHNAMLSYIYYLILPQVVLSSVAIFLQCMGILYMGRMVKAVAEHRRSVKKYKEYYRENFNEEKKQQQGKKAPTPTKGSIEMTPIKQVEMEPGEEIKDDEEEVKENPYYHTPSSILKTDHGYVQASGGTLDYLDSSPEETSMRNRKDKVPTTPSISFKADVEVHYYDQVSGEDTSPAAKE